MKSYVPEIHFYKENNCPQISDLKAKFAAAENAGCTLSLDEKEKTFCRVALLRQSRESAARKKTIPLTDPESHSVRQTLRLLFNEDDTHRKSKVHEFNSVGIRLRKENLFDESIQYYFKIIELGAEDENIYFNIARAYYEIKDFESCIKHLRTALAMNPEFLLAKRFLAHLNKIASELDERIRGLLRETMSELGGTPASGQESP